MIAIYEGQVNVYLCGWFTAFVKELLLSMAARWMFTCVGDLLPLFRNDCYPWRPGECLPVWAIYCLCLGMIVIHDSKVNVYLCGRFTAFVKEWLLSMAARWMFTCMNFTAFVKEWLLSMAARWMFTCVGDLLPSLRNDCYPWRPGECLPAWAIYCLR